VTNEDGPVTNAELSGTKGLRWIPLAREARRALVAAYAAWLGFSLIAQLVNAVSGARDIERLAMDAALWEPFVWEMTSWLGYALTAPLVLTLDAQLAAQGTRPPVRVLAYAAASFVFSGGHMLVMFGSRPLIYGLLGDRYGVGSLADRFVYEYPKDVVALLILLGVALFWRRAFAPEPAAEAAPPSDPSFLVRDSGGQTLIRAAEIDWVEAQGNYAALHVGERTHLVRQTMAEVERTLAGAGFIRTHRSALVSARRLKGVRDEAEGLFVVLDNGAHAPLSQGRKAEVLAVMKGEAPS
jgi:hypothetical protein